MSTSNTLSAARNNSAMKISVTAGLLVCALLLSVRPLYASSHKLMSLCGVHYPSDTKIEWECLKLTWRDYPEKLFGKYWRDVLRFNRLDRRHFIAGLSIKAPKRPEDVKDFTPLPAMYQDAADDAKFILIDQSEMFLGAYEHGNLVFSLPVAVGIEGHRVPDGEFRIDAVDRRHRSNLYTIEEKGIPYPMYYGLRFFVDKSVEGWPSFWIHGRDMPGYPASHGCIGLYDEEMQKEVYKEPKKVLLEDAKKLYRWVVGSHADSGRFRNISYGPRVKIIGTPPI
jgi:hypothetical protein